MQNSASGAQVVGKPSESSPGAVTRPPVDKPGPGPAPRWSGSLHELAARKQRKQVSRPPQPGKAVLPAPAAAAAWSASPAWYAGAAEPSARRLRAWRRQGSRDRRWQIPCWLTSFVLHLLAVVVLGSLTVPVSRRPRMISTLLTFGEMNAPSGDGLLDLSTISPAAIEEGESSGSDALPEIEDHMPVAAMEASMMQTALGLGGSSGPPVVPHMGQALPESSGPLAAALAPNPPPAAGKANPAADGESADHDEVVSRFIQFDIGHLRGVEGEKAREDFNRLGTEALGSLIRGLNRSAKMHASCPVVVISQKVGTILQQNPQPALLRYALDNIGRDVPHGAPHVRYLRALVTQLRHLDPSHSALNVPMLLASFKSRDVQAAIQAANVVAAQPGKLAEFEKGDVAWALIHLLTHRNADLRAAARTALVSLAKGKDFGPADDRHSADRIAAACKWSLELCPLRFEAAAESILNRAEKLDDAGKGAAAHRYYRQLVQEYAGTQAADEAAERLKRTAEFAFK